MDLLHKQVYHRGPRVVTISALCNVDTRSYRVNGDRCVAQRFRGRLTAQRARATYVTNVVHAGVGTLENVFGAISYRYRQYKRRHVISSHQAMLHRARSLVYEP